MLAPEFPVVARKHCLGHDMAEETIMSSIVDIVKALAPLAGAWVGFWLTRKTSLDTARNIATVDREKYKHNGLWEARRTAYTEIVTALTALAKSASLIDYHMNGEDAEAERYYASEQFNKHSQAMWEEYRAVKAHYDRHILVLSEAFKALFSQWQMDFHLEAEGIPPQQAEAQDGAMTIHIPKFIALAQQEIWPE